MANPSPKISVICIFYNAEKYFVDAIESVLAQSFDDFEFILADDGSADSSTSIARGYADRDPRVRHVEHEGHVNRGMSATRNLGLAAARGDFIAFIDADDIWETSKLEEQLAVFDIHPKIAMVCGAVRYWRSWSGGSDQVIPSGPAVDRPLAPPSVFLSIYPLGTAAAPCPSDLLLRTSAVRAVGGFESHFTGKRQMYEDQGFLAKIYLRFPVYFDSRCWLWYRQHEDSIVSRVTGDGGYDEVRLYFLTWLEGYLDLHPDLGGTAGRRAIRRALEKYRQPMLHAVRRLAGFARSLAGKLKRRARGAGPEYGRELR
jgi:glycosyltransferase involved in cell wall biosynthesis